MAFSVRSKILFIGTLLAGCAAPSAVSAAFKCALPDGSVVYQEVSCQRGTTNTILDTIPAFSSGYGAPTPVARDFGLPKPANTPVVRLPLALSNAELVGKLDVLLYSVTARLKDPQSAVFKYVCLQRGTLFGKEYFFAGGMVNAKNSYGGYVGEKMFAAIYGNDVVRGGSDDGILEVYVEHDGAKWLPPSEYFVCTNYVDDALIAEALKRSAGVSAH